jgi:uncharacterized lipoprotein YehR (DUF1307 family)
MTTTTNIQFKRIMRMGFFSALLFIAVALAFASKGGGDKKKSVTFKNDFVPIRTTNGFTLKSGVTYSGSHILSSEKNNKFFSYNSIVTYQKGNTTYILPYKYKVNIGPFNASPAKSNFQMLNLKINMHK